MDNILVKIVSKENIKPTSSTPICLKLFKLSVLDQTAPCLYIPSVFFYLNNVPTSNLNTHISSQSKQLKESLSNTLTLFYPFAGKVKDDFYIDCNDEGVYYLETQVNYRLGDFLSKPLENEPIVNQFIPQKATESPIGNYVVMVQVNFFTCGGIAICTCVSHTFIDGNTNIMFLEVWTALARGSSDIVYPNFSAPSLFPQIPSLLFDNPIQPNKIKFVTQRFVFDGPNIANLKAKTGLLSSGNEPTRYEAVVALLWKCATKAALKVEGGHSQRPFKIGQLINLRGKGNVPRNCVGNLIWLGIAECKLDKEIELHHLVEKLKKNKEIINTHFDEETKGEAETSTFEQMAEMMMMNSDDATSVSLLISTMSNTGVYDFDFGWGKPAWFYYCNVSLVNFISLCDTRSGGGMQAVVSLTEQDMAIFEQDPELLAFACLNPAPLKRVDFLSLLSRI